MAYGTDAAPSDMRANRKTLPLYVKSKRKRAWGRWLVVIILMVLAASRLAYDNNQPSIDAEPLRNNETQVHATAQATQAPAVRSFERIVIALFSSQVDPSFRGRKDRIHAICDSWAVAVNQNMHIAFVDDKISPYHDDLTRCGLFVTVPKKRSKTPVERFWWALEEIYHMYRKPAWVFIATDLTFLIPENLRCYLANLDTATPHVLTHRDRRLDASAGFALSREALKRTLGARHRGACVDARGDPAVSLGDCLDQAGLELRDALDDDGADRFNPHHPLVAAKPSSVAATFFNVTSRETRVMNGMLRHKTDDLLLTTSEPQLLVDEDRHLLAKMRSLSLVSCVFPSLRTDL